MPTIPRFLRPLALPAALLMALASTPAAAVEAPAPSGRLGDLARPLAERIDLEIDPDRPEFGGTVEIDLEIPAATRAVRFHARDLALERVELVAADGARLTLAPRVGDRGLVEAVAAEEIAPGRYTLEVGFAGTLGDRTVGLYGARVGERGYVFTQLQATDARRAFPCWDEPEFKVPFRLRLRVPAGHTAVTNTPVASEQVDGDWKTVTFAPTPPLPSYLLAIAVGPFERVPIPGLSVPGSIYTVAGQSALTAAAAELTPPILTALEGWFDSPYPFAKLDLIAVPEFWPGAMENPGAVTFAEGALLLEPGSTSPGQRQELVRLIAHELAHMWFGDLVTMRWWDDLWLNESFADWLGGKISTQLYPELGYELTALRDVEDIMETDARPTSPPIRKEVTSDARAMEGLGLAYAKGRGILGMIERWVGAETFRAGVLAYLATHAWGNAESADLWAALSKASGADVAGALAGFVEQPGLPLVEVEIDGEGRATLTQRRFLAHGVEAPAQSWRIPIELAVSAGGERRVHRLVLTGPRAKVDLGGAVDWVLPDAGGYGYYRWRVPTPMLLAIAGEAEEALSSRERIAFLGNAAALLDAAAIGGDTYLEVLRAFGGDPEPEVVSAVIDGLAKVNRAFVPDELEAAFAAFVRATLGPAVERFGWQRRPGEPETVSLVRPRLLAWLGDEGRDPGARAFAAGIVRAYLTDPESVDPALAGVALELSALDGDRATFADYRRRFEGATVPADRGRFLAALAAFDRPEVLRELLDYVVSGALRPNELMSTLGRAGSDEASSDVVFAWTLDHYDHLASRIPPDFVAFMPFIASGCSAERLARAQEFFSRPEHRVEGTERQLERVAEQVSDCVALRRREGAAVAGLLTAGGGG